MRAVAKRHCARYFLFATWKKGTAARFFRLRRASATEVGLKSRTSIRFFDHVLIRRDGVAIRYRPSQEPELPRGCQKKGAPNE